MNKVLSRKTHILFGVSLLMVILFSTCSAQPKEFSSAGETWGIYQLDLETGQVNTLYGTEQELSGLSLNAAGDWLVFSQMTGGTGYEFSEIYTLSILDRGLSRLTDNSNWDLYPVWSPDGSEIAFLSWRDSTLDIFLMDATGTNQALLYDSGFHDADIDWVGDKIVFTRQDRVWIMDSDGKNPRPITDPPRAGEWGQANLPFGDYDPRLSPDGTEIVFSRMIGDESTHGNYDIFQVNLDGSALLNLTKTGFSQGLSSWSPSGETILFIVSASGDKGLYDLYSINKDGSDNHQISPEYFPANFLIHSKKVNNYCFFGFHISILQS